MRGIHKNAVCTVITTVEVCLSFAIVYCGLESTPMLSVLQNGSRHEILRASGRWLELYLLKSRKILVHLKAQIQNLTALSPVNNFTIRSIRTICLALYYLVQNFNFMYSRISHRN